MMTAPKFQNLKPIMNGLSAVSTTLLAFTAIYSPMLPTIRDTPLLGQLPGAGLGYPYDCYLVTGDGQIINLSRICEGSSENELNQPPGFQNPEISPPNLPLPISGEAVPPIDEDGKSSLPLPNIGPSNQVDIPSSLPLPNTDPSDERD